MLGELKRSFQQTLPLLFAGVVVGAVAGWVGLANNTSPERAASSAAGLFLVLLVLLPLVLLTQVGFSLRQGGHFEAGTAIQMVLIVGLIGGLLGGLAFFVAAVNIMAIFGRVDAAAASDRLRESVGLTNFLLVVGATVLGGVAAGVWGFLARRPSQSS